MTMFFFNPNSVADKVKVCQDCFEDLIGESNNCYKMFHTGKNWQQASRQCREDKAKLVQIESEHENDEVLKYARNKVDESGSIWLGLRQSGNKRWLWQPENRRVSFEGWTENQPNDTYSQNCGTMSTSGEDAGGWNVDSCTNEHPYVCMSTKKGI